MGGELSCICGGTDYNSETEHGGVVVDSSGKSNATSIHVAECKCCGTIRQIGLPFSTEEEYKEYYKQYPPVGEAYVEKDYVHDRELASKRFDQHNVSGMLVDSKLLDVGSGSGAFVDECRARGVEAYGCEIAHYNYSEDGDKFTYRAKFEEVNFPTDYFDVVTCHDVLEHVLRPEEFLKEMFRVTKQNGLCFVEIPKFFSDAGGHHWKEAEHVWFFSAEQLRKLVEKVGFEVSSVDSPVESKLAFTLTKPEQKRTKILLPPGIGDSYWSIVKLQAFMEKYGTGLPDIYVACNRDRVDNGNRRAFPFIEMFPFLNSTDVSIGRNEHPSLRNLWHEAYSVQGRTVFRNACGCDYFVSYNGHLRFGEELEKVDPDLRCDWHPPMFISVEQERFRKECVAKYGRYIVVHVVFVGTYQFWTKEFPIKSVEESMTHLGKVTGCTPILAGAAWDKRDPSQDRVRKNIRNCVDMRGMTSVEQLFGLMRGAQAVVGYPSGLTIMGAMLGCKTLIIWNHYYNKDFYWNCAPPDVRGTTYQIETTRDLTQEKIASKVMALLGGDGSKKVEATDGFK